MRHARAAPGAVGPLAVAVIEAALRALLVPLAGGAETPGAALPATRQAAVDVAAIARGTEEEGLPAQAAGPHPEDLHGPTGPEMSGGLDKRGRVCDTYGRSVHAPRGVERPGGLELAPPGSHPFTAGIGAPYLKTASLSTLCAAVVRISTLIGARQ